MAFSPPVGKIPLVLDKDSTRNYTPSPLFLRGPQLLQPLLWAMLSVQTANPSVIQLGRLSSVESDSPASSLSSHGRTVLQGLRRLAWAHQLRGQA